MKTSFKPILPIAVGLLTLSACSNVNNRAKKYLADKPYAEYAAITEDHSTTLTQSKLDSTAYRDIFNGTQAAKDSALVAEFNEIANKTRGYDESISAWNKMLAVCQSLISQEISTKEYDEVTNKYSWSDFDERMANITQHYADDWAYRKFFEKAGIMNDSIAAKCDEVSKQIRP